MSNRRRMIAKLGPSGTKIKDLPIGSKIKFSSGKTFILQAKNVEGHEPNSVTLCSEYIIEDAFWNDNPSSDGRNTESYLYSDLHINIMPKYYNELSESEKKMIILRKFEVETYNSDINSGVVLDILFSTTVESFFYIASLDEVRVKSNARIDDYVARYPELFYSGALGNYSYDYSSNGMRKKTRKNGSSGEYFVTTTRSYSNGAGGGYNLYVNVIDRDGGLFAIENKTWERFDGMRPMALLVSSGVVPFCDIKGDAPMIQDGEYWVFVG